MAAHPDLPEEQRFLDRAYRGLASMRADATRMLESVLDLGRGGTFQSRTERDIVVRTSLARLAQLDIGDEALCFGRIDRLPDDGHPEGESFHIGRLAVSGDDLEPLVVDWRAPIAEPFYRATGVDPQGLARRRHLAVRGRTVVGIEDEYLAVPGPGARTPAPETDVGAGRLLDDTVLGGPAALLAAVGRARTGHMGDIVATIQREQDEIIRAPLAGVLMVQGGPGTGKTAVALHRAAYLLYTHRFPLERQGVLVIGPNPLFLRYIEQVLPSLGETGVTLSTVAALVPEVRVRAVDPPAVARLKGEARMAQVIARAIRTRQRPLRHDVVVPFGAAVLRLRADESADIVAAARRRPGPHNARRRFVEQQVLRRLVDRYLAHRAAFGSELGSEGGGAGDGRTEGAGRADGASGASADHSGPGHAGEATPRAGADLVVAPGAPGGVLEEGDEADRADTARRLLRVPELAAALDRMWPRLAPHELVHDLLGSPALLRAAGRGVLSAAEVELLHRARSTSLDEVPWTVGDAGLVDEARALLGPRRSRGVRARGDGRDRPGRAAEELAPRPLGPSPPPSPGNGWLAGEGEEVRSYGHIVVDEVQDLSPMQLRMVARRSLSGSMTVVGDVAQATGPWSPLGWEEVRAHLSPKREPKLVEMTVSYRTPAEVVAVAARVLAEAAPGLRAPRPVRASGHPPRFVRADPGTLAGRVAEVAAEELDAASPGRTAVLAPTPLLEAVARALRQHGLEPVDPRQPGGEGLAAALVVLPADEANGLEFDAVVVVEPARVVADGGPVPGARRAATRRGLRTLYVALTRPTRRLAVVHAEPLPPGLAPA